MTEADEKKKKKLRNMAELKRVHVNAYGGVVEDIKETAARKTAESLVAKDDVECRWLQGQAQAYMEMFDSFSNAQEDLEKMENPNNGGIV